MSKKILILTILGIFVTAGIVFGIYFIVNDKQNTSNVVGQITQYHTSNVRSGGYNYTYTFYPHGKNKYFLRKEQILHVGITEQYVKPTEVYTMVVKKSDMEKIQEELKKQDDGKNEIKYYINYSDIGPTESKSYEEFLDKLFK